MTELTFSSDLTTSSLGVKLSKNIESIDDFMALIQERDDICTDKIIDEAGQFHHFLMMVVDGELASMNTIHQSLLKPREITIFNAIAGG